MTESKSPASQISTTKKLRNTTGIHVLQRRIRYKMSEGEKQNTNCVFARAFSHNGNQITAIACTVYAAHRRRIIVLFSPLQAVATYLLLVCRFSCHCDHDRRCATHSHPRLCQPACLRNTAGQGAVSWHNIWKTCRLLCGSRQHSHTHIHTLLYRNNGHGFSSPATHTHFILK